MALDNAGYIEARIDHGNEDNEGWSAGEPQPVDLQRLSLNLELDDPAIVEALRTHPNDLAKAIAPVLG